MRVNLSAVGTITSETHVSWDARDCALFALACGAGFEDQALLAAPPDGCQHVLPAFPLALVSADAGRREDPLLGAGDFAGLLQVLSRQGMRMHRPLPADGTATLKTGLSAIHDTGSAAIVVLETIARDERDQALFTAETTMHIAGAGGFGGRLPPRPLRWQSPGEPPLASFAVKTLAVQSLLYGQVARDAHGIHVDPAAAVAAGMPRPILAGHNVLGFACRAIVAGLAQGDASRIRLISGRSAQPAYNGDTLSVRVWAARPTDTGAMQKFVFDVVNQRGEAVLDSGECTIARANVPADQADEDDLRRGSMGFSAFVLRKTEEGIAGAVEQVGEDALPEGDVLVDVACSSMNYKDGMVVKGLGRLVRDYPHVPGIDFAGTVSSSQDPRFKPGDEVVLTGWRVGEVHWGGFARKARVKGDWLVKLPEGLTPRQSMIIGTAGLTAMLSVIALEKAGLKPGGKPVLVTGAAGGVGSVAVALLAAAGYEVHASTGRAEQGEYLRKLGASEIVERSELSQDTGRPLGSERWAAAIDTVGSQTLATVLSQIAYGGAVAACGLAGGSDLPATVMPFLLRGVSLLGIDSVMCPLELREAAWRRIAQVMPRALMEEITTDVALADVPRIADEILAGKVRGRTVVDLGAA